MKKVYKMIFIIFIIISVYTGLYGVSAGQIWTDAGTWINGGETYYSSKVQTGWGTRLERWS